MVSVLISVYNQDPSSLVHDLLIQLEDSGSPFEIILGNDASDSKFMPIFRGLEGLNGVIVFHADINLGRSKIRNTLASQAKYPYLLFIDGDAGIKSSDFVSSYLDKARADTVICGGTAYSDTAPETQDELLRWKYGVAREARPAIRRVQKPYSSFSSFNFFIPAEVFDDIRFNEKILRYGHEDTIFGIELENKNYPVIHIDNQLIHKGLETAGLFLHKTRDSVEGLVELMNSYENPDDLIKKVRLLSKYRKLRKWGLSSLLTMINKSSGKRIRKNLTGPAPSLRLLDLYKLCILNDIQG